MIFHSHSEGPILDIVEKNTSCLSIELKCSFGEANTSYKGITKAIFSHVSSIVFSLMSCIIDYFGVFQEVTQQVQKGKHFLGM